VTLTRTAVTETAATGISARTAMLQLIIAIPVARLAGPVVAMDDVAHRTRNVAPAVNAVTIVNACSVGMASVHPSANGMRPAVTATAVIRAIVRHAWASHR